MNRMVLPAVLAALAPAAVAATPVELTHQGRLLDATGVGFNGTFAMTFTLYDAGGGALWSEALSVDLADGYYTVVLGTDPANPLTSAVTADATELGIAVGTDPELSPRTPLTATPVAARTADPQVPGTAQSCQAHYDAGFTASGPYSIDPDLSGPLAPMVVYCEQELNGGGWMRFELQTRQWGNSLGFGSDPDVYADAGTRVAGADNQSALNDLTSCSGDSQVAMVWRTLERTLTAGEIDAINAFTTQGWTGGYHTYDSDGDTNWDQIKGCHGGVVRMSADGGVDPNEANHLWAGPFPIDVLTGLFSTGIYGGNADYSGYNVSLPRYWYLK